MDCKEPKTRQEGKGVYNQKYIRLQEALMEKNNLKGNKDNNKK